MKGNDDDKQILCYLSAGLYPYYPYEYNISAKKIEQVIYDITTNQHRVNFFFKNKINIMCIFPFFNR